MARYLVEAKLTGADLLEKIEHIICVLYTRGFIVNQVCSDGTSENVSALKLLATYEAKDIFPNLNPKLPQTTRVAFRHPANDRYLIFVGGEMPHWVKRVVNGLENSSKSGHKRSLVMKGQPLGLNMIRKACEAVELGGIATLRQTKLTIDHFVKNPYSRMQVFLLVQILSSSVHNLLTQFVEGDDKLTEEYSSLMILIKNLN